MREAPSAPTYFRVQIVDTMAYANKRKLLKRLQSMAWKGGPGDITRIQQAQTAEELVSLAPLSKGLGEAVWDDRSRQLPAAEMLPAIRAALKNVGNMKDRDERTFLQERLIADLRWRDKQGGEVLLESFNSLDVYGKSLACVVLGLLNYQPAADVIWNYSQKVKTEGEENFVMGALWGLLDLKDPRLTDILLELLGRGRLSAELFAIFAVGGEARSVVPLIESASNLPEEDRINPIFALIVIAHRIGRQAFLDSMQSAKGAELDEEEVSVVGWFLERSETEAQLFFSGFLLGFSSEGMDEALARLPKFPPLV
jgi:hypothetical protein